jgi:hypothetical protein
MELQKCGSICFDIVFDLINPNYYFDQISTNMTYCSIYQLADGKKPYPAQSYIYNPK